MAKVTHTVQQLKHAKNAGFSTGVPEQVRLFLC